MLFLVTDLIVHVLLRYELVNPFCETGGRIYLDKCFKKTQQSRIMIHHTSYTVTCITYKLDILLSFL